MHAGTSCDAPPEAANAVDGHYHDADFAATDPWDESYAVWTSDSAGYASGSFDIATGYTDRDIAGHVMVVHASNGTRIACGVLDKVPGGMTDQNLRSVSGPYPTHKTVAETYPDYLGTLVPDVQGIWSTVMPGGSIRVTYNMQMKENTSTGGIHMHAGTSCDAAGDVGGHYYDDTLFTADPWDESYAVWMSDSAGHASGSYDIATGYTDSDIANRVMVSCKLFVFISQLSFCDCSI